MAKRGRPAQGRNSTRKIVKVAAGDSNVNASGANRPPRVNNTRPRKAT